MGNLRLEIVSLLRTNAAVRGIRVRHANIDYDARGFEKVAGLVHTSAISVGVQPNGKGASYSPSRDHLNVPVRSVASGLLRQGVILHEAVHALQDVEGLRAPAVDAEIVAYFVQATFVARSVGPQALTRGAGSGRSWEFRRIVADLVRRSHSYRHPVHLLPSHLADARKAYQAWDSRPDLDKPYGFNGVPHICRVR